MPITHKSREFEELASYLETIRGLAPLSRDEEHRLAVRARKGDRAAKEKLIRHNLALVVMFASRQRRGGVRLEDLVQEGNLGLMRAVEKFDPDAGTRFSTYAAWWIRAYVGKYLRQARSNVRPRSGTVAQPDLSLDAPIGDEEGDVSHLERLEDGAPDPEDTYVSAEGHRQVRESLARVRKRVGGLGWDIIHSRLGRDAPDTLEEIGRRWGISRERVRQVEMATRRFLRGHLEKVREPDSRDAA